MDRPWGVVEPGVESRQGRRHSASWSLRGWKLCKKSPQYLFFELISTHISTLKRIPPIVILRTYSIDIPLRAPTLTYAKFLGGRICDRLRAHWSSWATPIATQSASIATHLERSSGSLSEALQPPLDPTGTIALAFSDCLRNYSDIDDLHKSLMLMPSTSTGGMMGLTREHLSHAPDEIKRWILELTGDIFAGLSPSVLKLGVVAPLPKDAKRFRPVTLLEPITKLVTGTVARRLSLLLHKHSLLHQHQFGFVHGGSCEAPIEIVNDMYEHACEHDVALHVAYLDATSAFGTVQHPALTAAFAAIGAPPSFVKWIKFMVTGHRRVIRTAYSMGDPASEFPLESGTPQGDPLSPLLWATVVDFALRHAQAAGAPGFKIGHGHRAKSSAMQMTLHCSHTHTPTSRVLLNPSPQPWQRWESD